MDWVKLHTGYDQDPRILQAGDAAEILFLRALAYCGRHETGGFVHLKALRSMAKGWERRANALCSVGLWERMPTGFRFVSWDKWQDDHDYQAERRRRDRERKALRRKEERAAGSAPDATGSVRGQSADCPSNREEGEKRREIQTVEPPTVRNSPTREREHLWVVEA